MNRRMRLLALTLALTTGIGARPALAQDIPALVQLAAERHATESRGVVTYEVDSQVAIASPVFNTRSHSVDEIVLQEGDPVRSFVRRLETNGKLAREAERADLEARNNKNLREGKGVMRSPYDRRFLGDYRYTLGERGGSGPAGTQEVRFAAEKRDDHHGIGAMWIDPRGRVVAMRYTLAKLPEHVDRGTIEVKLAEIADGAFAPHTMHLLFEGSMGFIKGSFELTQHFDKYQRRKSLDEALANAGTDTQ